jgi:hypothetical protein
MYTVSISLNKISKKGSKWKLHVLWTGQKLSFRDKDVSKWEISSAGCCGTVNNWQRQKQQKYDCKACENDNKNYIKQTKYIYVHTHKFFQKCHAVDIFVSRGVIHKWCYTLMGEEAETFAMMCDKGARWGVFKISCCHKSLVWFCAYLERLLYTY